MLKVRFIKAIDRVIGTLLVEMTPAPRVPPPCEPRRILFIRPGGIGDAVLLIPAMRAVKKRYPGCQITVLAEKRNGAVFSLCGDVRQVFRYDRFGEILKAVGGAYDVVVDTEQWHRLSAFFARCTGAPMVIGFATNQRSRMFTHAVPYSHESYEVLSFFNLLKPLGIDIVSNPVSSFLDVPEKAFAGADAKLGSLAGQVFLTIFPGASIPERRWGSAKFRELAVRLQGRGYPVVVVGGKGDEEAGWEIVGEGGGLNLAGRTSLPETAAVIARSMLLITGDSGVLHIAVGVGTRTVSLFGPGIEKKWAPSGDCHMVLNKGLSCSPCTRFGYTPTCRIGARCLAEITVGEVEDAVIRLLTSHPEVKSRENDNKNLDKKDVTC